MSLTKSQLPLDSQTEALLEQVRPLSDYKLRFINHQYPLLSMMYAMFAGGENTLYCDHTDDFVAQYLFANPDAPTDAETAKATRVGTALKRIGDLRAETQNLPAEQQAVLQPDSAEWDKILAILKEELTQNVAPDGTVGAGAPPPPTPMW
jgi:hypothetical protein